MIGPLVSMSIMIQSWVSRAMGLSILLGVSKLTRRDALGAGLALLAGCASPSPGGAGFRIAPFSADVTPPIGHPLLAGLCLPAAEIADPLFAKGFVLLGGSAPIVQCAVDWCEIRNESHDRWRAALAEAAGTTPTRVLLSCVHQHDAPLGDLEADRILRAEGLPDRITDPEFHERAVRATAATARKAVSHARPVTHLGLGRARVEQVASNRRTIGADGTPRHDRMSACRDPKLREQPEGTIDPWLRTISFWDGDRPLVALSSYATHPMSYYRTGKVSADFPGLARRKRQEEDPSVLQIYASGCSGNVIAGKYNDGSPEMRPVLAERMHRGMKTAWESTERRPLERVSFRAASLRLEPRGAPGFTVAELEKKLDPATPANQRVLAAMGLSWRKRADAGYRLDVPAIDFGGAQIVLLPGESYVEYQLLAQELRPDQFVMALGYGECAPGYIPTERHWEEKDSNLNDWCWVAPGAQPAMTSALREALRSP
jgi:hypothetical protein